MSYAKNLFEQVRIKGNVRLSGNEIPDSLPIIYTGEDENGTAYYNSGGRSLIFENGSYKVSGVDPYGHLTHIVAASKENRINDVRIADREFQKDNKSFSEKPFGVYTRKNIEQAQEAFRRLNKSYEKNNIVPPCELVKYCNINEIGGDIYQMLYKLPSIESDLRVSEILELIEDHLSNASQKTLQDKTVAVNRLCGRIVAWIGYSMQTLYDNNLVPTEASWAMQNMVFHHIGNGYGAFRVDHTSTQADNHGILEDFHDRMEKNFDDPNFPAYQVSFLTEAVQIGANFPQIADNLPDRHLTPFKRVIDYYTKGYDEPLTNITQLVNSHRNVFQIGRTCAKNGSSNALAISEQLLMDIFK